MNMVNSKIKGNIAESRILYEFVQRGVPVSIPYGDNERYDMIAEFNGKLNKIQIKFCGQESQDGSVVCMCYSTMTPLTERHKVSYANDVDFMAFFLYKWDVAILVPIQYIGTRMCLKVRKEPAKNNQQALVTFVDDFTFDKIITQTVQDDIRSECMDVKRNINRCVDCGCMISRGATRCYNCENTERHKLANERIPVDRDELKVLIRDEPFTVIGERYRVTDNCVRKWCKKYNLPYRASDIKKYTDDEWNNI